MMGSNREFEGKHVSLGVIRFWFFLMVVASSIIISASAKSEEKILFPDWLKELRLEAEQKGISKKTLDRTLAKIMPIPRIIELDRRQPEFTLTFWRYITRAVSESRVEAGKKMLVKHKKLLKEVEEKFGVQGRFLISFWGLETNYGRTTGSFPLIGSLVTLAYDQRRPTFFRNQLFAALKIIDAGDISGDVMSSWAGAMGNMQFIPSTYQTYAIDGDGDGKRDLWGSLPDIFYSAANYLSKAGWKDGYTWGREVSLPKDFDFLSADLKVSKDLKEWERLGVRQINQSDLPNADIKASLIVPAGYRGPAFLVYQNFFTTLIWNRSIFYAIAIGHLADRIDGRGHFFSSEPSSEATLSISQIKNIQKNLTKLGFDAGSADGVVGSKTRGAIRKFQKNIGIPADAYPSNDLQKKLMEIVDKR